MISPAASAAAKLAIALRYATAGFGIVVAAGAMLIWTKDIFILLFGFRSAEEILPGIDEQIGSASCRGKSVSVRVDRGGRRIIKKKKKTPQYRPYNKTK